MLVRVQRWLCILLALLTTVYGLYIPANRYSRTRTVQVDRRAHRRSFDQLLLARKMTHLRSQYENDNVNELFTLFDLNGNNVINRNEFRTILKMLGVYSSV